MHTDWDHTISVDDEPCEKHEYKKATPPLKKLYSDTISVSSAAPPLNEKEEIIVSEP